MKQRVRNNNRGKPYMIHRNLPLHLTVAIAAFFVLCLATAPALAAPLKNIILVHGAWADGSGWRGVYDILVKDGYNVSIVQEPETSFQEDVAATKRVLVHNLWPISSGWQKSSAFPPRQVNPPIPYTNV
jgi:hypothetical protein